MDEVEEVLMPQLNLSKWSNVMKVEAVLFIAHLVSILAPVAVFSTPQMDAWDCHNA